jgi:hypothetical protein
VRFEDGFQQALGRGRAGSREGAARPGPMSLEDAAREFGPNRAAQNKALAARFGVSVRTVQRWRSTGAERRSPGADRMRRLRIAAARRAGERRRREARRRGVRIDVGGRIRVSRDTRDRTVSGLSVSGESMAEVLDLLAEGDREGAMEQFSEALGAENGFGDALEVEDLDWIEMELEGEDEE